jgi:dihydroxy-acid dehydratase
LNKIAPPIKPDVVKHDYDLSQPLDTSSGLRQGLTSYRDAHFSLFLRKVFIEALGYSEDALSRPIIGIINTNSGFNPCHGNAPQLIGPTDEILCGGIYHIIY